MIILILNLAAFSLTILLSSFMLKYIKIRGFFDAPDGNRKTHKHSVPRFGGIPFSFITLFTSAIYVFFNSNYTWYVYGTFIIFLIGLMDDVYRISWRIKTFCQIIVSLLIFSHFSTSLPSLIFFNFQFQLPLIIFGLIFIIWFLGILNAVNLADGMDGLAGGVFLLISLTASYLGWFYQANIFMVFYMILCTSLLGFLFYNGRPAKFFMGDTGSLFLGYNLAIMPLLFYTETISTLTLNLTPFVILSSYFIIDTLRVFISRIRRRQNPLTPDRTHFHHLVLDKLKSYNATLLIVYLINFIFIILCFLSLKNTSTSFFYAYILLITCTIMFKAPLSKLLDTAHLLYKSLNGINRIIKSKSFNIKPFILHCLLILYTMFTIILFFYSLFFMLSIKQLLLIGLITICTTLLFYANKLSKKMIIYNCCFLFFVTSYEFSWFSNYPLLLSFIKSLTPWIATIAMVIMFLNPKQLSSFRFRFWVVEDLIVTTFFLFFLVSTVAKFQFPPLFPPFHVFLESTLFYFILRLLILEKQPGKLKLAEYL